MIIRDIHPTWSLMVALGQVGLFPANQMIRLLQVDMPFLLAKEDHFRRQKIDPSARMGFFRHRNQWLIKMETFSQWYLTEVHGKVLRRPLPNWDANILLSQIGLFLLADVCQFMPFSAGQMRYQAKKYDNPRESIGVWKLEGGRFAGSWAVDMAKFGPYIKTIYRKPR